MDTKERILVIGGDVDVRCTLVDQLWKDYTVDISESYEDALNNIKNQLYSVVLVPVDALGVKCVEVVHKFKETTSDIPVVVITTHQSVSLAVEAMKAGAYGYITKPFNTDELKLVILHAAEWHKLKEEVKEKKIFEELSLLDGLTHVYNRRYFDELLGREIKRAMRYPQQFSLLFVDMDDFKKYNDTYGHATGDAVLKELADFILSVSRATDFVARYGGEEFVIIAPHTDKKNAMVLAVRLVLLVANKKFVNAPNNQITMSVGVATFGEDAKTKEDLIAFADKALYRAKKMGKNRACMYGNGA